MYRNKRHTSPGVLTKAMITQAAAYAERDFGTPTTFHTSPNMIRVLIAWEKQEKWLKSLPAINEKMERLRIRLKERKPHTPVNLPE